MKRNRQIALTCIISISILLIIYLMISSSKQNDYKTIYIVEEECAAGTQLSSEKLIPIRITADSNVLDAILDLEQIENKFASIDFKPGDVVKSSNIVSKYEDLSYANLMEGYELYSVAFKAEDANGWWLIEGHAADIYVYVPSLYDQFQANDGSVVISQEEEQVQVFENVRMVRIFNEYGSSISENDRSTRIISFELTSEQITKLVTAQKYGLIKISASNDNTTKGQEYE